MNAAIGLMFAALIVLALIVGFIVRVNGQIQRQQRERHFGDISHVRIPDDMSSLEQRRERPKPPYRPL